MNIAIIQCSRSGDTLKEGRSVRQTLPNRESEHNRFAFWVAQRFQRVRENSISIVISRACSHVAIVLLPLPGLQLSPSREQMCQGVGDCRQRELSRPLDLPAGAELPHPSLLASALQRPVRPAPCVAPVAPPRCVASCASLSVPDCAPDSACTLASTWVNTSFRARPCRPRNACHDSSDAHLSNSSTMAST
jgi:hypothetical protein